MKRALVFVCVLVIALGGLAGCGADKKAEASKEQPKQEESKDDPIEDVKSDAELIHDYIAERKTQFDQVKEEYKDQMDFNVTAEGSALIYSYQFLIHVPEVDAVKSAMDAEVANQEGALKLVLADMKLFGMKEPVVIYRYLNDDGSEIASYEYK